MSEVNDLEKTLLEKDGPTAAKDAGLPGDFREKLAHLIQDPTGRAADAATRIASVKRLLKQLDGSDNDVVKRQKRTVIRWEINALRELEKMG